MTSRRVISSKLYRPPAINICRSAQLAVMGLVILSVVSRDVRLAERAWSALPPPMQTINPSNQPGGLDYPRGGSQQLFYDETLVVRRALPLTSRIYYPHQGMVTDTVQAGDTIFGIAQQFSLQPESSQPAPLDLKDEPELSSVGMDITVPLVDVVMHIVQKEETRDSIARQDNRRGVGVETGAVRQALPGATRATDQGSWTDAGQCAGVTPTSIGTGKFIWPTNVHQVSVNSYTWWHRGIDLSGSSGDPVCAADTGAVIWAGPASQGYGLMVMLDHGNGWQTLYAHLSQVYVHCGQNIPPGAVIGAVGSTGHSTGPHLHFETRLNGDPVDPCGMQTGLEQACLPGTFNIGPSALIGSWLGRYYDNMFLDGDPSLVRTDLAIDFDWGHGSPGGGLPKALWSARWTRTVDFAAGIYGFHAIVDDGIRVFVDDQAVIDEWQDAAGAEYVGDKALAAGIHTVKVEYYQKGHQAKIRFWWESLR